MLIAWFPILVIPLSASYVQAKSEGNRSPDSRDNLSSLYDQTLTACESSNEIENLLKEQLSPQDRSWKDSNDVYASEESSDEWTEGQHWREKRETDDLSEDVHYLLDHLDSKRANPSFNSWGGKRTSNFHSWGGKRSDEDAETDLDASIEETKRADPFVYLKFADSLSTSNGGFKRRPAFNSWGGKRSGPAFNSWGGKRSPSGPAFNSWGGKRGPAFNSWGGKRDGPAFNSWGGKRGPAFNSWGGKRAAAFNSWGGKRAAAFNSWGGKRSPAFNSWGGKRVPAFNSWGWKRGTQFNSWGGKRSVQFNSWGGKRDTSESLNSGGGKRGPAFHSWGGKRSLDFNDNELVHENKEDSTNTLPEEVSEENGAIEQVSLQKREAKKSTDLAAKVSSSVNSENNHSLRKREVREVSKERVLSSDFSKRETDISESKASSTLNERVLPSLEAAQRLYRNYREREKKCSELKSRLNGERIRYLLNYIMNLKLLDREPEEKKSVIHKMLLRAADYHPDGSTYNQARRGAEFHSWGGKRSGSSNFERYE